MKINSKMKCVLALALELSACAASGHAVLVHRAITVNAAASAFESSPAYASFFDVISSDLPFEDATNFMVIGSAEEDALPTEDPVGGFRSLNHFYDPLTGLGLSNIPYDDRPTSGTIGSDSFTWGSKRNSPGKFGAYNVWSWQNARDHEWLGLTAASPSARRDALTNMFRAVGQVVHLVEDASQPEHVRNEQHLAPGSPIEKYGGKHLATLNYQNGMLDWKRLGFTKLEDFWDRQLYTGSASALSADANGGAKLGMAEFANGNFLGGRHLFPEYFKQGDVQYYPFPSRDKSTNYKQVKADPSIGLDTYTLKNGHEAKGIYIKKNSDGVTVDHLSRINYLGAKKFSGLAGPAFCTINDTNVLDDYHDILIPKAVEYSTGILDYYFRGQVGVNFLGWDESYQQFSLRITNKSGMNFQGGAFKLFRDDSNGQRTEVPITTDYSGSLADNGTITARFDNPGTNFEKLTAIYKGTVGSSGSTALDPVDANIAIAAKQIGGCMPEVYPPASLPNLPSTYPSRVRMKNYEAEVKTNLVGCVSCTNAIGPEWDGTFTQLVYDDDPDFLQLEWQTDVPSGGYTIGGKGSHLHSVVFWDPDGFWGMALYCSTPGLAFPVNIWYGIKLSGDTPEGKYSRTAETGGCSPQSDAIRCITIEYY